MPSKAGKTEATKKEKKVAVAAAAAVASQTRLTVLRGLVWHAEQQQQEKEKEQQGGFPGVWFPRFPRREAPRDFLAF